MRFTFLLPSSALAASLMLSACSGTQAVPSGAQAVAPMGHQGHATTLLFNGLRADASCPKKYSGCYDVKPGATYKEELCIVVASEANGTCNTSVLAPGTWKWSASKVYKAGKTKAKASGFTVTFKPNPGNPTDNDVKVAGSVKSTKGKVGYYFDLTSCNGSSSCDGPYAIGLIVK